MLRIGIRQPVRRVRQDHRHRLEGTFFRSDRVRQNAKKRKTVRPYVMTYTFRFALGFVVQGQTLARSVFLVQQMSRLVGGQTVRIESGKDLLRQLLRLSVCR